MHDVSPSGGKARRVRWHWRVSAWVVAVPLGLAVAVGVSYATGLVTRNDVLDVFVSSGSHQYALLVPVAGLWAATTAMLVHLFIEGGRWGTSRMARRQMSNRRDEGALGGVA